MNPLNIKTNFVVWTLLGSGVMACAFASIFFFSPPPSKNTNEWFEFGSYFAGLLGPILGLLNLAALLFIAVRVTTMQQTSLAAKRLSMDLYTEWHSESLHESRRIVSDLISSCEKNQRPMPTLSELEISNAQLRVHAFRLYQFFEKWAVLSELREVDEQILKKALGSRAHWYRNHFSNLHEKQKATLIFSAHSTISKHMFSRIFLMQTNS